MLSAFAAAVLHWAIRYRLFSGLEAFFGTWITGWIGARLSSAVLGKWFGPVMLWNTYILPAMIGAFAGAFGATACCRVAGRVQSQTGILENTERPSASRYPALAAARSVASCARGMRCLSLCDRMGLDSSYRIGVQGPHLVEFLSRMVQQATSTIPRPSLGLAARPSRYYRLREPRRTKASDIFLHAGAGSNDWCSKTQHKKREQQKVQKLLQSFYRLPANGDDDFKTSKSAALFIHRREHLNLRSPMATQKCARYPPPICPSCPGSQACAAIIGRGDHCAPLLTVTRPSAPTDICSLKRDGQATTTCGLGFHGAPAISQGHT